MPSLYESARLIAIEEHGWQMQVADLLLIEAQRYIERGEYEEGLDYLYLYVASREDNLRYILDAVPEALDLTMYNPERILRAWLDAATFDPSAERQDNGGN